MRGKVRWEPEVRKQLSQDGVMRELIQRLGVVEREESEDLFEDLVYSVVSQQLSDKAAATIFSRFKKLFAKLPVNAAEIVRLPREKVREAGISYSKADYIIGIGKAVVEKRLDLAGLVKLEDEEVVMELTKLKGVGRWTAEMFLIFSLGREDVFSLGDLGLRTAVAKLYGVSRENLAAIEEISKRWSPYRSWACRYLWRSLEKTIS